MADSKGNTEGNKATPDLIKLASRVNTMVKVAEADNKQWEKMYREAIRYIYGDQLHNIATRRGWERIQANYLLPAQRQTIALICQQKTKVLANPQEDGDIPGAEMWQGVLQWEYEKGVKIPHRRVDWLQDGFASGVYATYIYRDEKPDGGWDAVNEEWKGRTVVQALRSEWVGVDPTAESVSIHHAEFVYIKMPVSVEALQDRYPDAKDEIERAAGVEWEYEQGGDEGGIIVTKNQEATATEGTSYKTGHRDAGADSAPAEGELANLLLKKPEDKFYRKDGSDKPAKVTLLRLWFKDRTSQKVKRTRNRPVEETDLEGITKLDEATGFRVDAESGERYDKDTWEEEYEIEVPKYPFGRYIEMVGKNIILNPKLDAIPSEGGQVWDYDEWPVLVGQYGLLPHTWRGLNGVEMVKTLQDYINISIMFMLTNVKFFGLPAWLVEEDAVVVPKGMALADAIRSVPGAIIKLVHGAKQRGAVERLAPPAMNQAAAGNLDTLREELRQGTSVQDVIQGGAGKEQTATEALRRETNSRINLSLLLWGLDEHTLDVMNWVFKIDKRHMSPEEQVRILGENSVQSVMEFGSQSEFDAKFDLRLEVGTALPFDQERKKNESLTLMQQIGPAYLPWLLDTFDVPNKEELLAGNDIVQIIQALQELDPEQAQALLAEFQAAIQEAMTMAEGGGEPTQNTQSGLQEQPVESAPPPNAAMGFTPEMVTGQEVSVGP